MTIISGAFCIPSRRSRFSKKMGFSTLWNLAFFFAISKAFSEMSVARMRASGRFLARDIAIAPEPVPISIMRMADGGWLIIFCFRLSAICNKPFAMFITSSRSSSVSGRGIRVSSVTMNFSL